MIEILTFIFQSFWHWFGSFLLLAVIFQGISYVFASVFESKK